jgi:type I restriction enzyme S subunit
MEKLKNIPSLRFPEFKEKWKMKKLGEVSEISSGGTPSRTNPNYWNGNIPWVSTTLIDFNIIEKTEELITAEGLKNSSAKLFPIGTLLMAMYGQGKTRGKVAILGIEASTNQACGAIMPNTNTLNSFFLFQNLSKRYDEIRDLSNQGGQENLSGGILKGIGISFPTPKEQQKIATFLTAVDEKLQAMKQKKILLEQYKKGVMQQLFSQELRFKDDNGNDFEDWEEKKLGEIGETYNGLTGKTKEHFGSGKPYIQYKQIFDDANIDVSRFELVEIISTENQNKVLFGDVFFTVSSETPNEIGMASVLLDNVEELYLNSFCFGYRANSLEILSPYFSKYLFRSELFRNDIVKLAQGSTRFNMSKVQLMKLEVQLPCLVEQIKIANFLSSIDDKINHCELQISNTVLWKKGLLQKMFV